MERGVSLEERPLLEVHNLSVEFRLRGGMPTRGRPVVHAVDDVSFAIPAGTTLGLVGESGSGKSTVAKVLLRLLFPARGTVRLGEYDYAELGRWPSRAFRRDIQAVFQDPASSLNPVHAVGEIIAEPLRLHFGLRGGELDGRVIELLELVGLTAGQRDRQPYELSGGQQQRIALARALASRPRLLVCDEPVAALDVSTQAQIVNLLAELQRELGVAYLFIGHDLDVVSHVSDELAVMYLGRIVETGPVERVFGAPAHPYTEMLLRAVPIADPVLQRERRSVRRRVRTTVEPPSPIDRPRGCAFQARCPYVMDICRRVAPELTPAPGGGFAACHRHADRAAGNRDPDTRRTSWRSASPTSR